MTRVTGRRAAESAGLEPGLITAGVEDWPDENPTSSNHKTVIFAARMSPPLMAQGRPSELARKPRQHLHVPASVLVRRSLLCGALDTERRRLCGRMQTLRFEMATG